MPSLTFPAPAKLNLFLAITGRRSDGFHDLVSVVAPVGWGDTLRVEAAAAGFALACDDPAVPLDESNLVLKAARAFQRATGWKGGAKFFLEKRIPMGAGLGGGSSDGAAALRALNELAGKPLDPPALEKLAGEIGSDCALFLRGGPVVMRGRGEIIESLPAAVAARLRGRRVLIFKPAFGIATPWAYARLAAAAPQSYLPAAEAEARLGAWIADAPAPVERLLFNNMEAPAFAKHVALPVLLTQLRDRFGLAPRMSGSGSACFAFLPENAPVAEISATIGNAWGKSAFVIEERLL
ncbi:MAG TPA: 4-(cytidine 5'-diphospho)-2-C-methyl-D-erythritol kinase [Opitutaceae bacterium]|nr:4-(cytidine 5'-diphospho)-2-C-methyl-D-erythritol kinase [Opitutaceae bacterium]